MGSLEAGIPRKWKKEMAYSFTMKQSDNLLNYSLPEAANSGKWRDL